jgi:hypothetical protein
MKEWKLKLKLGQRGRSCNDEVVGSFRVKTPAR